jgi:small subunit ribosomal protein S20
MANIKSAMKRNRQNVNRRTRNRFHRSTMRTEIKTFLASVESGDKEAADAALRVTISKIDQTGKRRTIHPRKADRLKARLTRRFNRAFPQ